MVVKKVRSCSLQYLIFQRLLVIYGHSSVSICGGAMGSNRKWYRAHAWPKVTSSEVTWLFPFLFSLNFLHVLLFSVLFLFPYFFPCFCIPFFPRKKIVLLENTEENCEMIWTIWKKGKLTSDKIWTIWRKGNLKCEKI